MRKPESPLERNEDSNDKSEAQSLPLLGQEGTGLSLTRLELRSAIFFIVGSHALEIDNPCVVGINYGPL